MCLIFAYRYIVLDLDGVLVILHESAPKFNCFSLLRQQIYFIIFSSKFRFLIIEIWESNRPRAGHAFPRPPD